MPLTTPRLVISCPAASFDGKYHTRYPHGDAPAGAVLSGAASDSVSAAALLSSGGGGAGSFDFYISVTGSDSNSGSLAAPFAITSLQDSNANNSKFAGKKVGLIAGTYSLSTLQSGSQPNDYQHPILHLPAGTLSSPTYIASCNSSGVYTPRVAVLNWAGSTTTNSVIGQNLSQGGNWTIDGLTITGSSTCAQGTTGASCKQIGYYPSGTAGPVTVQNCDMGNMNILTISSGSNDGCIFMQGHTNAVIRNNKFHDVQKTADVNHGHGFIEYSAVGTLFTQNSVINCCTGIDGKVNDNGCLIAANYFYNCGTTDPNAAVIQGYDGAQNTILGTNTFRNNVFDSNIGPTKKIDASSTNAINQPLLVFNNTVYDTRTGGHDMWDLRASLASAIAFHDNIMVTTAMTSSAGNGRLALTSGDVSGCDFNCYSFSNQSAGWGLSGATQNTFALWKTASSLDAHSVAASPVFSGGTIVPGGGAAQFNLGSGSPCIGTGTSGINMGAWDGTVAQIGCNF